MLDDVWDWGPRRPMENDLRYLSFDHREDGGVFNYHVLSPQIYSPGVVFHVYALYIQFHGSIHPAQYQRSVPNITGE
jgi:hypothetical protein